MARHVSRLVTIGGPHYYLRLLHANIINESPEARQEFVRGTHKALARTKRKHVDELLDRPEWRGRLFASWVATCNGWNDYRDQLGALLLASELVYSGQGYCTALASFGTDAAAQHLVDYLDLYLHRTDLVYDQRWALGALRHLDDERGSCFVLGVV